MCYIFPIMLKRLALRYWPLAVLVVLVAAIFCMSRYAENRKAEHQDNAQASSPNAVISPNGNGQGAQNTNEPHKYPSWIDTFAWPEGATAWALFLTLMVIAWQSVETRAAADAAKDSIRLQEIALAQWPDIQIIGLVLLQRPESPNRLTLTMRWKVLNNTALPFTIHGIEIHLAKSTNAWEINRVKETETLPPGGGDLRNFYPFFVEVDLDEEETAEFLSNCVVITVQINVSYVDASGKSQERFFGDQYECTKTSMKTMDTWGKSPRKRIESDDSPSTIVARPVDIITHTDDGQESAEQNSPKPN